jgi:rubrerythrin
MENTQKDVLKKILSFAMRMEKDAEKFYTFYIEQVKSEESKKLFEELAEIEKNHYAVLKKKYDVLEFNEPPITISWVVDNSSKAIDPHIISDNSDVLGYSEAQYDDMNIMRMAYLIENDFAEFYGSAANAVDDPEIKGFLNTMAKWENKHRELFYGKYRGMLKKQWADIASIILPD